MQRVLQARWLLPIDAPAVEGGVVVVEDGQIVEVGRHRTTVHVHEDFGDAVLLPGFVNAHSHLELTHLRGQVPFEGSFNEWIKRIARNAPIRSGPESVADGIREGLRQSLRAGVTTIADIGNGPAAAEAWRETPLRVVGFLEVIGICDKHIREVGYARSVQAVVELWAREDPAPNSSNRYHLAISPHAPYSTRADLYRQAIAHAAPASRPITTHLAETPDEDSFVRHGSGTLRELLEWFDQWDGTFEPGDCSPVAYAHRLGLFETEPILAHVNYADDRDIALLADSGAHVAYCPRAHRFFRHAAHPYRRMLAAGVNVCIGTDSLASNETLSVLDELRFMRSACGDVSDHQLLHMGTLAGARALRKGMLVGALCPGKRADLVAVPLEHPAAVDPAADVLRSTRPVAAVFVDGRSLGID